MNWRLSILIGLSAVSAGASGACGHAPAVVAECHEFEPVPVVLRATDKLNPDPQGRPLPTVVRLLQLRDLAGLDKLDLQDVWEHEREQLAASFIFVQEVTLNPGERLVLQVAPQPEARHFVALALFRQPKSDSWRAHVSVPSPAERRCASSKESARTGMTGADGRVFTLDGFQIKGAS